MKTNLFSKSAFVLSALTSLCLRSAPAQEINSTFTGADFGSWSDPANWSPALVPNNSGTQIFNVAIPSAVDVTLDIDPTVNSFTVTGDAPPADANIVSVDHSFTSLASSIGNNGAIDFTADTKDVTVNFGNLADFSGTTLNTGLFYSLTASAGRTVTLQFNGAHIVTNVGGLGLNGPGIHRIVDEHGADALADFNLNAHGPPGLPGYLQVVDGASYTIESSFTNAGDIVIAENATVTFAHDLTQIGDIRDPSTVGGGFLELFSSSADNPARVVIQGTLTNYDSATKTLHSGRFNLGESAKDGVTSIQVLGGDPIDIVHNDASIILVEPGAAFLDKDGADALRNLLINFRFRLIDHDFTTVGPLTTNTDSQSLLAIRGSTHFTVATNLLIMGGTLELSPLTGGYDLSAPLSNSELEVKGNLTMAANTKLRFEVSGSDAAGTVNVMGHAALAGTLEIFVLPDAPIKSKHASLTLLTAGTLTGKFSNVKGNHVTAFAVTDFNGPAGQFNGTPIGTFRIKTTKHSLVITGFHPLKD